MKIIFTAISFGMFLFLASFYVTAEVKDITYPIAELASCKNKAECLAYCDARDNFERARVCTNFAKKHNLLSAEEIEQAEKYLALGVYQGPGGCKNEIACDVYCADTTHLNECLDFAERYSLRSKNEIAEGRKVAAILKAGGNLPGGCRTKNECMAYCEEPGHMKECVDFAESAGFISDDELKIARKIIPLLASGGETPGNCARKDACETYCMDAAHIDDCIAFAERVDLLSPEELADAKKFTPYIKSGETPGKCRRRAECETYCSDVSHFEECVVFAEKVGMMSAEDVTLARKVKGKGPGGCTSKEACEKFCGIPENIPTCINFAKEHGLEDEFSEIKEKVRGEVESKMMECAAKSCTEMIACLQEFQTQNEDKGIDDLPDTVKSKLDICVEEIKADAMKNAGGINEHPELKPGSALPSGSADTQVEEETKRQYEVEYKKQYDEEYKRQLEEQLKSQCPKFEPAPTCDYVGAPGTEMYNFCKQCFPNK